MAGLPLDVVGRHGASAPFAEHEAETAFTDGEIIGPDRTFGTLAAEASGRRAVRLDAPGESVAFILDAPADALTVRYSVPDAAPCRSGDTTLAVLIDGQPAGRLPLTPCYGWFYGDYPFTNDPAAGGAHHFYDHARLRLERPAPVGARVELVFETGPAPWVVIDLADFELVPPANTPPPGDLSVLDFGADPTGVASSRVAIQRALDQGRRSRRPVWLPEGRFRVEGHLTIDKVTLAGAGPWRSILFGDGVGLYGRKAAAGGSHDVVLKDLAIVGEVMDRDDHAQLNGVGGALNRSRLSNLFIQHTKVGVWLDGPMSDLTVTGLRILDQTADGLNLHGGVTNAVVEQSFVRNTGDDGLAAWSHRTPNRNIVYRDNTIVAPVLANGVAIYGGRDITVSNTLVADTLTRGGGLHLGARFDATAFAGNIFLSDNLVARAGSIDPVWNHGVGALWLYALDPPITGARIRIEETTILDSTDAAFMVLGKPIRGLTIDGGQITGGASVLQIRAPGEASVSNIAAEEIRSSVDRHQPAFDLHDGGGNVGWQPEP
nr:glycosyl hydrolase family 28-related protein [Brevundimonas alba]